MNPAARRIESRILFRRLLPRFSKLPLPSSVLYARVSIATGTVELALQTWLRESRGVIILVIDVIFLIIIRLIFDKSLGVQIYPFGGNIHVLYASFVRCGFFFFNLAVRVLISTSSTHVRHSIYLINYLLARS